ncbi:MAG: phosphoribosylformylglycinamidine cyclo-ligase [Sulfolobales archaeon]
MSDWTYSKAGVDLSSISKLHEIALKKVLKVNELLKVKYGGIGGFATWVDVGGIKLVLHCDGVGTKSIIARILGRYWVIGWDSVIVNVNDVVCGGAKPVALVSYVAMEKPDEQAYRGIINGVEKAALENGIAMMGGETAVLPDLVNGIDVSCTLLAVRKVEKEVSVGKNDIILGLPSSGLHANGYSLVRKVVESTVGYDAFVEGVNIGEELVKPVINYGPLIMEAFSNDLITAAAHISGGAFKKVKRILDSRHNIVINAPKPPKVFEVLMNLGRISISEMYRVFNMGVGMVVALPDQNVGEFKRVALKYGLNAIDLGYVTEGEGKVIVNSYYGDVIEF